MSQFVELFRDGDVATVQLNRPKVNALSIGMLDEIAAAFGELNNDLPRAVLLWGGPKSFSAGADIDEMGTPEAAQNFAEAFRRVTSAIEELPRIVVAAIGGFALGGGLEVALAADIRLAARGAKFGTPEIKLGLLPGGGATARLPRLIGVARALQLAISGEPVDANIALDWRLIDHVVDGDEFEVEARAYVDEIASGPTVAQSHIKEVMRAYRVSGIDGALDAEKQAFVNVFRTADAAEGLTAFREKRKAEFQGR